MARSNYVAKARKSPGQCGKCGRTIKVGEAYVWWKFRHGGKHIRCAAHPPRQSDLTASDKLSRAYAAGEGIEDDADALRSAATIVQTHIVGALRHDDAEVRGVSGFYDAYEGAKGTLELNASEVQEVAQEYNDAADNIEQSFSSSPTADECREKADALDEWASSIENSETSVSEFWSAFDPFFERAKAEAWLEASFIQTAEKALDDAEGDGSEEHWQQALNFAMQALRAVRANEAAVALFNEALDAAFDAMETVASNIETVASELSI